MLMNGYGMSQRLFYAPDNGGGAGTEAGDVGADTEATNVSNEDNGNDSLNAEIARLKTELARQKNSIDKATKEAAAYKRQLREHQTAEEAAAEEQKAAKEAQETELNELRKKFAVMETTKNVAVKLNSDEATAEKIANMLYGAEDADGALLEIQKLMTTREKALRTEFGKIPPPAAGGADGPTITKSELMAMGYRDRSDFASKHPEEYSRLMGR